MAMKQWFRRLQPLQLYALLVLSVGFLLVQLVMSHTTHALTLLLESYHMLCNIIALVGCIISIKYGSANLGNEQAVSNPMDSDDSPVSLSASTSCYLDPTVVVTTTNFNKCGHVHQSQQQGTNSREKRLKNTFGWARIDVLVMLSGCVFLASLCFSVVIEALQTLVHIKHQDEMHHPIPVMCVGAVGLLLNGLCYLLIGGYTFHQGSFLHVTSSGDIVLDHKVSQKSEGRTRQPSDTPGATQQRQGMWEMCRDVLGCVIMILCAMVVYAIEDDYGKFVDPVLSIVSAILLFVLSYPFMKESGYILLQTIPDSINIDSLRADLLKAFPDIINVHDLHVWRLTADKVFSTAHIIFLNAKDYVRITKDVIEFFHDQGITQVTIQPEFFKMDNHSNLTPLPNENLCLVPCRAPQCVNLHCCLNEEELTAVAVTKNDHNHLKKLKKQDAVSSVREPEPHNCQSSSATCMRSIEINSLQTTSITHPEGETKDNNSAQQQQSWEEAQSKSELQGSVAGTPTLSEVNASEMRLDAKETRTDVPPEVTQNIETKKHSYSESELSNVHSTVENEKCIAACKEHTPKSNDSTASTITHEKESKQNNVNVSSLNKKETEECSKTDEVTRL